MGDSPAQLIGRDLDVELVRGFVADAAVRGAALLVSGDAGVGKTALLDVAVLHAEAAGTRVVRAAGAEFEAELGFSGLNVVLHPLLGGVRMLPPLHRQALSVALGLDAGSPSDRLVVSNAVLALLRDAAVTRPLLVVVVDDLQWLDRASSLVLASAVRRLAGTGVGFLAALRTESESFFDRAGLPGYELEPLDRAAAASLLEQRFPALTPPVRERLIADAQGNPLALLELPIALRDARPARPHLAEALPLTARLQALFASRITHLPAPTIALLLTAVLDGTGDLRVLEAAAPAEPGLDHLAAAERAGIIQVDESDARLVFRHPLIRSAVVALSTSDQRRRAHRALAACVSVPGRRAWHLAEATVGPDESVASLLEGAARDHLNRGDAVSAIAEMSRAAELSPATADQGRRWAEAAYIGATVLGDLRNAPRVLDDVREIDPDHAGSLAGAVAGAYHLLNGDGDVDTAHRLLVGALETAPGCTDAHDEVLVEAIYNLLEVCFFGGRAGLWPPFHRAIGRLKPRAPRFLELLAKTIPDPARHAVTALGRLEEAIAGLNRESSQTRIVRIAVASAYIDRLPQCRPALWRVVHDGRAGGAVTMSIHALALLGFDYYLTGQWDSLAEMAAEGVSWCDSRSYGLLRWPARFQQALLAAARGDSATARAITEEMIGWAVPRRAGAVHAYAWHARALDAIGRADFENAYRDACAISPAGTIASHVPHAMWMVLDLVEAAMRTGRTDEAAAHVAAAQETGLPAISSRLALITSGAAAMAASFGGRLRTEGTVIMNIRPALITGGSLALGVLALGAVRSGLPLTMTPGRGTPSAGWAPMPDPAGGGVASPPFPANLTAEERAHLETFDALDFEVFTTHDWARLAESHAPNIRVHFPDGHYTDGIDKHIADMASWAEWAPDIAIRVHPLRLAKDNLTAVIGVMNGTFSKPMPDGKGGTIAPTGKAFAVDMVTVGIWNRQGTMDEEFLFWDNQTFYGEMGPG